MDTRGMRRMTVGSEMRGGRVVIDVPMAAAASCTRLRSGERAVAAPVRGWFTRHMRMLVVVSLACATFLALWGSGAWSGDPTPAASGTPAASADVVHYTVRSGDTLWSIARWCGYANEQEGVSRLMAVNDLSTAELSPGQHLLLPMDL
ncbi:hypothetical protein B1400_1091 [Bifidobacterium italicum]|uniref:LysM domain-containing protein n=2 Tax=Bifidobacterium italicum TaxID=1960968 RepID=A0A2A2EJU0_9BIFI|nr:hypothetical protein B1400_1091 [Bifidobacterium italicum]